MKKISTIFILAFLLSLGACSSDKSAIGMDSSADLSSEEISAALAALPMGVVTDSLETFLQYLREEEKLARDVYTKSFELYDYDVFNRISKSEQHHMDAIKMLLNRYDIEDPVGENPVGIFVNKDLSELYNTLIQRSADSLKAALLVGAEIEEIDILDILNSLDQFENEDVQLVLNHLLKGSYHHLNAYVRNLSINGIEYQPKYLSSEQYLQILANPGNRGNGGKGRGHRNGGRRGRGPRH